MRRTARCGAVLKRPMSNSELRLVQKIFDTDAFNDYFIKAKLIYDVKQNRWAKSKLKIRTYMYPEQTGYYHDKTKCEIHEFDLSKKTKLEN